MLPTIARNEEGAWLRSRSRSNRDDTDPDVEVNIPSPRYQEEQSEFHFLKISISKLVNECRSLECQILARDALAEQLRSAIGAAETTQAAGLADLRGRVARCDAAINSLAVDNKDRDNRVRRGAQEDDNKWLKMERRMQKLDDNVNILSSKVDTSDIVNQSKLSNLAGDTGQQIKSADASVNSHLERLRFSIQSQKRDANEDTQKLENKIIHYFDSKFTEVEKRFSNMESSMQNHIMHHKEQLKELELKINDDKIQIMESHKNLHKTLSTAITDALRERDVAFDKLKKEVRKGFLNVNDSLTDLQQVDEGKRKILKEQLRKEINDVQKMFFLV